MESETNVELLAAWDDDTVDRHWNWVSRKLAKQTDSLIGENILQSEGLKTSNHPYKVRQRPYQRGWMPYVYFVRGAREMSKKGLIHM